MWFENRQKIFAVNVQIFYDVLRTPSPTPILLIYQFLILFCQVSFFNPEGENSGTSTFM